MIPDLYISRWEKKTTDQKLEILREAIIELEEEMIKSE